MRIVVICIIIAILIIIAVLYSKREYYVSNSYKTDEYIELWNNHMFVSSCDEPINYTICYHDTTSYRYMNDHYNIVLDGEPKDITNIKADLVLSTKRRRIPSNAPVIYSPYFIWSFIQSNIDPSTLIKKPDEISNIIKSKKKFCCFAYSNCDEKMDGVRTRREFLGILNSLSGNRVSNIGKCYGGIPDGHWSRNYEMYIPYKFVIAFENNEIEGYISEKLTMPMIARSIPIYFGPDISEYFNKKSVIFVNDFSSLEDCARYVLYVDGNEQEYKRILSEPYLIKSDIDRDQFSMYYGGNFFRSLYDLLPENLSRYIRPCKMFSNKVSFLTFADGKNYKYDRVLFQAKESRFFDECIGLNRKNLENTPFWSKHSDFIKNNRKGFGYWIWKPFIILDQLSKMENGDFLIYCDSGTEINKKGQKRLLDYLEECNRTGIVVFNVKYREKSFTKQDLFTFLSKHYNIAIKESITETDQIMAGFCCLKKQQNIIRFLQEWLFMCERYDNINDSSRERNSSDFIEHRHDQSVFSVLLKLFGIGTVLSDNYEDSKESVNDLFPFVFARNRD